MTAAEFKKAFLIADDETVENLISTEDISIFDGFGLSDFTPTVATLRQVAALMRWQALFFMRPKNGSKWDTDALNEIREACRKKVTVLG